MSQHQHHCPNHFAVYQCERGYCGGGLVYVCLPCEKQLLTETRRKQVTDADVLSALRGGAVTSVDIAIKTGMPRHRMSTVLRNLEKRGLIVRTGTIPSEHNTVPLITWKLNA